MKYFYTAQPNGGGGRLRKRVSRTPAGGLGWPGSRLYRGWWPGGGGRFARPRRVALVEEASDGCSEHRPGVFGTPAAACAGGCSRLPAASGRDKIRMRASGGQSRRSTVSRQCEQRRSLIRPMLDSD